MHCHWVPFFRLCKNTLDVSDVYKLPTCTFYVVVCTEYIVFVYWRGMAHARDDSLCLDLSSDQKVYITVGSNHLSVRTA